MANLHEHVVNASQSVCGSQVVFVMPGVHQRVPPALLLGHVDPRVYHTLVHLKCNELYLILESITHLYT
ncbi:hypothetical protein DPMN_137516 [Dreissena polymorpha]|uniref:Uncharacterized protein n=1 Tax=Dreissena polymorpha TaxID=45954 RepID=A0A9D4G1Z1_DREPO|nr:hypothetical protein DPMN_137516 [Dreissena polymorpha]